MDSKEIGGGVFEELLNDVPGENGKYEMVRESNEEILERTGGQRTLLNNILCRKSI